MLRPGDEPIRGYRLETFLGKGQFGQVWQTTAPGGGSAALKFLDLAGKEGRKELRGIQKVKAIRHAHLMPITALWVLDDDGIILHDDELLKLTPEPSAEATLVPGDVIPAAQQPRWLVVAQVLAEKTLRDQLNHYQAQGQAGIPVAELLTYMEEAAKGIDYLNGEQHDLGDGRAAVQHCDIKPANMLLVGGSVMVCDFGLAHILADDSASRTTGIPGSPAFIAPECIDQRPSSSSDQYSLAVSYFELRTGRLPFEDQTPLGALDAHRSGNLDFSELPEAEAEVIRKATALQPSQRFASCTEFVRALATATGAHATPALPRTSSAAWLLPGVATLVLVGALLCLLLWPRPPQAPPTHTLRITVEPPNATVTIDGERATTTQGALELTRDPTDVVQLVVNAGDDFDTHAQNVVVRDFTTENPLQITLATSALAHAREADRRRRTGDLPGAIRELGMAIKKDAQLAAFPVTQPFTAASAQAPVTHMTAAGNGTALITGNGQGGLSYWRWSAAGTSPNAPTQQHQHAGALESLVAADHWIASADNQGSIAVFTDDLSPVSELKLETPDPIVVAVDKDSQTLVAGSGENLYAWQRDATGAFDKRALGKHNDFISAVAITSGGEAVSASWDGQVRRWPPTAPVPLGQIQGEIFALALGTDQVAFAGAESGEGNHVYVTKLAGGTPLQLPEAHRSPIATLAFSPSGQWLAAGTEDDGRVSVWSERSGRWQRLALPTSHEDTVTQLLFGGDRWLVSAANDGQVILWDLQESATRQVTLASGLAPIKDLASVHGGKLLLVLTADGHVLSLDLEQCQLIKQAADTQNIPLVRPTPAAEDVEA